MTDSQATLDAGAANASDATAAAPRRPMREEDLLELVWIADPQMSPDGAHVAFTRVEVDAAEDAYRTALWVVPVAGGEARPLTAGPRDGQPRWSPDGRRIAFVRKPDGEKPAQIHVLPMDGGESAALTSLEKGASNPAWSPDGTRIAFSSETNPALDRVAPGATAPVKPKNEPGRVVTRVMFRENDIGFYDFDHPQHVWVTDALHDERGAGGAPRQLTTGRFNEGPPRWSRDGRSVLFTSDRREEPWFGLDENRLYAVAADVAAPVDGAERVAEFRGPVREFAEAADGRIAVIGAVLPEKHSSYDQMTLLEIAGARPVTAPRVVPKTGRTTWGDGVNSDQHPPRGGGSTPLAWAADGAAVVALGSREGASRLVRVDAKTGEERELTPSDRDLIAGTVSADGRTWALTLGSVDRPGDLYVLDAESGALTKRYAPNDALFARVSLGSVEEVWLSSFDGTKIHAWIVKPPDFDATKQYPLVLEIHGGPHTAYGVGFFHEFHVLAGAGNVVLYTNPRGSTSYGWEFANVIQYVFPGDDAKDLLAAVEAVVARGYIDPKKIGVTGGSGGGLLTNWLIAQSDRFAAACTQRCVTDWASMMYSADFAMFGPFWFRAQPHENPQEYAERSPGTYVDRIHTPLMILHSEEDWRTPIAQGEILFRALKYMKRPVVMVRFPGENHELSRSGTPSRRVQNQRHIRRWFDHWLHGLRADEYGV